VAAVALFTILSAGSNTSAQKKADAVIVHGKVYTLDSQQPWAEALAIRGDRIVAVGSDAEIAKLQSRHTHVIDAKGRLAGFREKAEGSLEPGKVADLIILSQNLFEVDPNSINKTKVLPTIVGGRVVFEAQ